MIEVTESHEAKVGAMTVRRALPRRGRRTVGAWCFADHMGPVNVTEGAGPDVGPHPHMGLHTVTWLVDGQMLHKDSLGSEQVIRPGELNLMTAGAGIAHAEEATGQFIGTMQGIQLWVAQPEATRWGASAFEHHASLPQAELSGGIATVLVGDFAGASSPAHRDSELVGVELLVLGTTAMSLRPDFEYGVIVLEGAISIEDEPIVPGRLGYLGLGRSELQVQAHETSRVMLLGGVPFETPILMWWNFVGRSRDEIDAALASWAKRDERFGRVKSALPLAPMPSELPRIRIPDSGDKLG